MVKSAIKRNKARVPLLNAVKWVTPKPGDLQQPLCAIAPGSSAGSMGISSGRQAAFRWEPAGVIAKVPAWDSCGPQHKCLMAQLRETCTQERACQGNQHAPSLRLSPRSHPASLLHPPLARAVTEASPAPRSGHRVCYLMEGVQVTYGKSMEPTFGESTLPQLGQGEGNLRVKMEKSGTGQTHHSTAERAGRRGTMALTNGVSALGMDSWQPPCRACEEQPHCALPTHSTQIVLVPWVWSVPRPHVLRAWNPVQQRPEVGLWIDQGALTPSVD